MSAQTGLYIVQGILRKINAYQSGEQIAAPDAQDTLNVVNDMLDSWSTDKLSVFGSNENILSWIVGQNQYRIGNPTCTALGEPPFTGSLTINSNIVTGVTIIPADLVAGTNYNAVGAGSTVTDLQNLLPPNTYVTAIGSNTVTLSAKAKASSNGLDQLTYTIPGDFPIPRPLRITDGFTRLNQLDFSIEVTESQERYLEILYKAQPGPWPVVAWYNNLMPYGVLNVYQTPSNTASLHLFTDTILANLTLAGTLVLPPGYSRAIQWCGAEEVWSEFNGASSIPPMIAKKSAESMSFIKALNAQPAATAVYDRVLVRGNRVDAGWITHGGYGGNR